MKEFLDFLGGQAPYDALDGADLERLAAVVEVEYFTKGTTIVEADGEPLRHLYVVRNGEMEVLDRGRVIDSLSTGDTFGHVSVLSGLPPALTVRASEDTLCYRLPDPRTVIRNPERLRFANYSTLISRDRLTAPGLMHGGQRAISDFVRPIVWSARGTSVADAAAAVTEAGQSCVLIDLGQELGIVTDVDFRAYLAGRRPGVSYDIASIATSPVRSVPEDTMSHAAFVEMVEHGVHHLVVTGSDGRPSGVVRVVDLAAVEVRNPLVIRRAIEDAADVAQLARAARLLPSTVIEMHDMGVPAMHVAGLLAAVLDAIVVRLLEVTDGGPSDVNPTASWLLLGSVARREPFPRSDLDTALVWQDPPALGSSAHQLRQAASRVLDNLERCGLRRCPDGANADNPLFSRPRAAWVAATTGWITDPAAESALLMTSMLADSRPLTSVELGRSVTDEMLATGRSREFLEALLRFTLSRRPPLGFVRDFVVEHTGEQRGRLDLKAGGLVPIASLGRWIALVTGDDRGSTPIRIRRGRAAGLLTQDESDTLIGAFEQTYSLILDREVESMRSGSPASTWVSPGELDTLTRRFLRENFRAVAQVQRTLESEWVARLQ